MQPSTTESNALAAMRSFLLAVLPSGTDVIAATGNRVPEPQGTNFVVMTPIRGDRIETNIDDYLDVKFTGSISGTTLTVSSVAFGTVQVGSTIFGANVASGTTILAQLTGTSGGAGTYQIQPSQSVSLETMASGGETIELRQQELIQLDFHSADTSAGDMANTVQALFRDDYAVQQFAGQTPAYSVVPLHADAARYLPFINESQQYEWRWVVEAMLQVNSVVSVPQQFADSVAVTTVSVDAAYPP